VFWECIIASLQPVLFTRPVPGHLARWPIDQFAVIRSVSLPIGLVAYSSCTIIIYAQLRRPSTLSIFPGRMYWIVKSLWTFIACDLFNVTLILSWECRKLLTIQYFSPGPRLHVSEVMLRYGLIGLHANNESSKVIDILLPVTFDFNPSTSQAW